MFLFHFIKKQFNSTTVYIFTATLVFYILLWFINPGNKIIAASFVVLGFIYNFRLRDVRLSLLLTYLASLVVLTGKTYTIQLIPPGIFPTDRWPEGYIIRFIISMRHVLTGLIFLTLARDWKTWRHMIVSARDIFIISYFSLTLCSSFFASNNPGVSLIFTLASLDGLALYFFLRANIFRWKQFLPIIIGLLIAILTFESLVSFQQLLASSPIGKNIEAKQGIEFFGEAVDEIDLSFRPVGTFNHANMLGGIITFLLPVALTYFFINPSYWLFVVFLSGLMTLIFTLSRSAWAVYIFVSIWSIYYLRPHLKLKLPHFSQGKSLLIFIIIALIFGFFVLPRLKSSVYLFSPEGGGGYVRLQQTQGALELILRNPLLGVGATMSVPEEFSLDPKGLLASFPSPVHNLYLIKAAETGIPATLLLIFFVLSYVYQILLKLKNRHTERINLITTTGYFSGTVALLIIGFFQPYDTLVFIILGFVIATYGH